MLDIVERILAALIILALVSLLIVLASRSTKNGDERPDPAAAKTEKTVNKPSSVKDRAAGPRCRDCGDDGISRSRRYAQHPAPCETSGSGCGYGPRRRDPDYDDDYVPPSRPPCGPRSGRAEPCECEEKWRPYWSRYRYAGGCDG